MRNVSGLPVLLSFLLGLALAACQSTELLPAGEAGNVETVASDDLEMNAAIQQAQGSLDVFIAALASPAPGQTYFSIKARFPYGSGDAAEHMWLDDVAFDGERFEATLANEPIYVSDLHIGDRVTIERERISDWMIVDNGRLLGGFTIYVLRSRLSEDERRQFDEEFGLELGEGPEIP